jgi:tetratricopeptide (TPR) repeat protein
MGSSKGYARRSSQWEKWSRLAIRRYWSGLSVACIVIATYLCLMMARTAPSSSIPLASSPKDACLVMIMKNEGPLLPRLFASVQNFVSEYCIVDTGSPDFDMPALLRSKGIHMPGVVVKEPFVDFATTRNFLLGTCRRRMTCNYFVLLDADMVLKVSPEWNWNKLDGKDVYDVIQSSSIEYANVRIIKRTADKIKLVGATHEYYEVPQEYSKGLLPKHLVYIEDIGDGKAKDDKFGRDERLLRLDLQSNPDNARTVFYLANTLKDQGKYAEAIPLYERRVEMIGWAAEAEYSLYMLSTCYLGLGDLDKARKYAEEAALTRVQNKRAEPLYFLALYLHRQSQYDLAWHYAKLAATVSMPSLTNTLFVSTDVYDYWMAYEQASLCPYVLIQEPSCLQTMADFLSIPTAPEHLRIYIRAEYAAAQERAVHEKSNP